MVRSSFFIDGFNFYHALKRLQRPHLKWVDLRALMKRQTSSSETISAIYYFSAFANWMPAAKSRHERYIAALQSADVTVVMGHFKNKDRHCSTCGARWIGHEEKETDVNIALAILSEAYRNSYDRAYVLSRDSDLKPAIAMVRSLFPSKEVVVVAPPHLGHSTDLINVASAKRKISLKQVEDCLFPQTVLDAGGNAVAHRPLEYDPPVSKPDPTP